MKIAICEDDAGQAKRAQAYIRSLAQEFPIEAVEVYTTGDALSKVLEAGAQFDIYLLDIDLPGVSGIALAEQIRSKQPVCLHCIFDKLSAICHACVCTAKCTIFFEAHWKRSLSFCDEKNDEGLYQGMGHSGFGESAHSHPAAAGYHLYRILSWDYERLDKRAVVWRAGQCQGVEAHLVSARFFAEPSRIFCKSKTRVCN